MSNGNAPKAATPYQRKFSGKFLEGFTITFMVYKDIFHLSLHPDVNVFIHKHSPLYK